MQVEWFCENCQTWLGKIRPTECPKCKSPAFKSIFLHVREEDENLGDDKNG